MCSGCDDRFDYVVASAAVGNSSAISPLPVQSHVQDFNSFKPAPPESTRNSVSQLRSIFTDLYRIASNPWRAMRLRKMRSTGTVPVFSVFYHRIAKSDPNPWSMDFATFKHQIRWMQERFDIISMQEAQQRIDSGFNDRPAIVITFDDGYAENCEEALPFLICEKIPVTYFVTTGNAVNALPFQHDVDLGRPLPINTIESLRSIANAGIEIGAHTRTHPDLGSLEDPEKIFDEVVNATRDLEQAIGKKINYFAFPFGQYVNMQASIFHLLKQQGIKGVCSAYGGWNEIGGDSFHIQRVHGDPNFSRMQNWLSFDPRIGSVERFDYSETEASIDWDAWVKENPNFQNNEPQKPLKADAAEEAKKKTTQATK